MVASPGTSGESQAAGPYRSKSADRHVRITIRPRDVQPDQPRVRRVLRPLGLQVAVVLFDVDAHVPALENIAAQYLIIPGPIQCGGSLSVYQRLVDLWWAHKSRCGRGGPYGS